MITYSGSATVYNRTFDSETETETVDSEAVNNNRIAINVAGLHYETYESTLSRFPETLLGCPQKRAKYYNPARDEYHFPFINRIAFDFILFFYQSGGKLVFPVDLSEDVFLEEVKFFELEQTAEAKCQTDEAVLSCDVPLLHGSRRKKTAYGNSSATTQQKIWASLTTWISVSAKVMSWLCISVITVYVTIFCVKTLPEFNLNSHSNVCAYEQSTEVGNVTYSDTSAFPSTSHYNIRKGSGFDVALFWSVCEKLCISWFLLEFILRAASSPNRKDYFTSGAAVTDFMSFLPYFVLVILCHANPEGSTAFKVLERLLNFFTVFCILKLARYSSGLRLVWLTLRSSLNELVLLLYCVLISVVVFSSFVYFMEDNKDFRSIPGCFWYTVITMTTVGYGDVVPVTIGGKLVGAFCGLFGVTYLMALPTTVIVSNFSRFYQKTKMAKTGKTMTKQNEVSEEPGQRSLMRRESLQRWISTFQTVTEKRRYRAGVTSTDGRASKSNAREEIV